jgi:hypothetical protein
MNRFYTAACAAFILISGASAQENLSTWASAKPIRVNTSATGANLANGLTNYPLLVRLNATNAADVFATAKAGGADLRFRRIPGPALPYEIERWDATAQIADIWVRVDAVSANDSAQTIWLYWGKADAPAASSGASVFNSSNGFAAVWHMNGAGNGGMVDETDATGNLNATQYNNNGTNPASASNGPIGYHRILSASSSTSGQGFTTNDASKANFLFTDNYTVSAWANPTTIDHAAYPTIVTKHDNQWALRVNTNVTGPWLFFYGNQGGSNAWPEVKSNTNAVNGEWTHVVGVRSINDDAMILYLNGALEATTFGPGTEGSQVTDNSVAIGRRAEAEDRFWNGALDEIRLESVARSADWVKLDFESQKPGNNLLKFGATQAPISVSHRLPVATQSAFTARRSGGTFVFALPPEVANGSKVARLTVMDAQGRVSWTSQSAAGARSIVWNGRGADGKFAANGLYFARLVSAEGKTWDARLAVTR